MNRRRFLARLAGVAVVPAVPVTPAFSVMSHDDASIGRAHVARPQLTHDDLVPYIYMGFVTSSVTSLRR